MTKRTGVPAEVLVVGSVLFATTGQLIIKLGLGRGPGPWSWSPHPLRAPLTAGVLCGLMIYGLGTLLWLAAVSKRNISYLYPLASLNYVLVALGGHLLLGEPLVRGRWLGIGIMAAGIVLLTSVAPRPEVSPEVGLETPTEPAIEPGRATGMETA